MFVTNDDVVLNVTSQGAESRSFGFHGWIPWVRRIRYSRPKKTALKIRTDLAYAFQSCSRSPPSATIARSTNPMRISPRYTRVM